MCMQLTSASDRELVREYVSGNETALEFLLERHKKRLFAYILNITPDRDLANDVFQDTFYKVIMTLRKGQYQEEGKFLPWLERIAHNLLIDHFRKLKKVPLSTTATDEDGQPVELLTLLSDTAAEDEAMDVRQRGKVLKNLIALLPDDQREVILMRHYYDMSFKEIAVATNVSINTALGRMRYALMNMRKLMAEKKLQLI